RSDNAEFGYPPPVRRRGAKGVGEGPGERAREKVVGESDRTKAEGERALRSLLRSREMRLIQEGHQCGGASDCKARVTRLECLCSRVLSMTGAIPVAELGHAPGHGCQIAQQNANRLRSLSVLRNCVGH